jgi:hypothetical protein
MLPAELKVVEQQPGGTAKHSKTSLLFDDALLSAERLMKYAADNGIEIDEQVRNHVLQARASGSGRTDEETANFLSALTEMARRLKPVTAESLKHCAKEEHRIVRVYWLSTTVLALIIVAFSVLSFITAATSDAIQKDIVTANELAVKLTTQFESLRAAASASSTLTSGDVPLNTPDLPPGLTRQELVTELQQFAAITRVIYRRAQQLNVFLAHIGQDPYPEIAQQKTIPQKLERLRAMFELPLPLRLVPKTADDRVHTYQDVRYFAQTVTEGVSFWYGAFTVCLLPVLYALLGTCAYLLRCFEQQIRTKTFVPSVTNSTRFLVAGIGGAVVGLFNNLMMPQGPSVPPLAIAFLVGYAVDLFFSFLEGLLQTFTKATNGTRQAPGTLSQNG